MSALVDHPLPWRIEITKTGGEVLDAHDNPVTAFDDEVDPEFWIDLVAAMNARDGLTGELRKQIAWLRHIRPELTGTVSGSVISGLDQSIKYMTAAIAKAEGGAA